MSIEPVPWDSQALADKPWLLHQTFLLWLDSVRAQLARSADVVGSQTSEDQAASIATTTILTAPATGTYRVQTLTRVTQAATTSSSIQITIAWTAGGAAQSFSGSALTGNTVQTQEAVDRLIDADEGTDITLTTTYASVGATPMQYRVSVVVERYP